MLSLGGEYDASKKSQTKNEIKVGRQYVVKDEGNLSNFRQRYGNILTNEVKSNIAIFEIDIFTRCLFVSLSLSVSLSLILCR